MLNRKKNKREKNPKSFAIAMGVVWAFIIGAVILVIGRINTYEYTYLPNTEYIYSNIARHDFGGFYSRYLSIISNHIDYETAPEYKEIISLGKYQENALMYGLYKEHGMEDKASFYKGKMEEYRDSLGDLSFATEEIDDICRIK